MPNKTISNRPTRMTPSVCLPQVINNLRRRAERMSGNASDAWDLVQDTLERGLRKCPRALASADDAPWLYKVLKNLHLDQVRSAHWRAGIHADPELVDMLPSPEASDFPLWRTVDPAYLRSGMRQLRPELRQVLVLQTRRLTLRQIAGILRVHPITVGTMAHRARRQLRDILALGQAAPSRRQARSPE